MKWFRRMAITLLALIGLCALFAPAIAPYGYEEQFRESADAPPGARFLLGTDEIGRDRFSRLLYATRISAVLAPAAAAVSILVALIIAGLAGRAASGIITLGLSLPWIFLFLILRSELPLNTTPAASIAATFGLMGLAGWAWPARVFAASIRQMRQSGWLVHARASGLPEWRIAIAHGWPRLRAVALSQFRVLVPVYILSEASLGLLGLGVADPLPSWGNLLKDLQHPAMIHDNPWILAPLLLLMTVMICLESLQVKADFGGNA